MRKVRMLLCVLLAAVLLAGCIATPFSSSAPPVSSPAPTPTPTPAAQATVTTGEGLTLIAAVEEAALLERLGKPGAALCSPVFVSADRLLLPVRCC